MCSLCSKEKMNQKYCMHSFTAVERKGLYAGHAQCTEHIVSIVSIVLSAHCLGHENLTYHTGSFTQSYGLV